MGMSPAEKTKRYRERRLEEIEQMPKIPCECGCGLLIAPLTKQFKPARFARGHNPGREGTQFAKGQEAWNKGKPAPWSTETHQGKKKSPDEIKRRTQSRLEKNGGVYQTKFSGHPDGWRKNVTEANRQRDLTGENNPFYGKTHTPETRAIISEANTGKNHPCWNGGVSTLPYGTEFTRKFKRMLRERDNYTCQSCGITQSEYGRTLQIHHIDHDKLNNNPTNLVTVCGSCNMWYCWNRDQSFVVMGRKP